MQLIAYNKNSFPEEENVKAVQRKQANQVNLVNDC